MGQMFIAVIFFAIASSLVKAHPEIPYYQWAFFRAGFILVIAFIYMRLKRVSVLGNNKKLLLARGIFGTLGVVLFFYTIQNASLGTAATIQYLSPLFAVIIATFFFGEPAGKRQGFAFVLAFLGVLVMNVGDIQLSYVVTGVGVFAAVCSAFAYNCIRLLRTTDHPMTVVFYFPLVTFPLTGVAVWKNWVAPSLEAWVHIFIFAALTMISQYLMTISYQQNLMKKVSIVKYVGVVISFIFGWLFFDEQAHFVTLLGAGIILTALYLNRSPKVA
ncbi:MAG: DMT family transporter [Bdellovibrionales bacterium]